IATVAVAGPPISRLAPSTHGWTTFLILAAAASIAQLFVVTVTTNREQSYHTATVFLIAAALLLPPELVALMCIVMHIPEWLKLRYPWYIQTFNICNYTLDALAAWGTARLVLGSGLFDPRFRWALAGLAACMAFVLINHFVFAAMLNLARGRRLTETGL